MSSRRPPADRRIWRLWTDPRLLAWTLLSFVASPLLLVAKLKRHFLQGYQWEFDLRRWTVPSYGPNAPKGTKLVFVGAGPGELIMIDRLIEALQKRELDLEIGICLRDLDAIDRLHVERPAQRFSVWPFDFLFPVARWLRREQPDIVVFVDRFRFTNLACGSARFGARLALVNGRSRHRNSFAYRIAAGYYRWQLGGFRLMAMEDLASEEAARGMAPSQCIVLSMGSLKADLGPPIESDRTALTSWLNLEDGTSLLVAGSTRNAEEEAMILDAYRRVQAVIPCRLMFAPRELRRVPELVTLVEKSGLSTNLRTVGGPTADVFILDTFGELSQAYGLGQVAYVGGSYSKGGGGHNVIEPLRWGVPVSYGCQRGNFASLQQLCEARGVATRVGDAEELAAFWLRFAQDADERARVGALGEALVEESRGAIDRTVAALSELIQGRQ